MLNNTWKRRLEEVSEFIWNVWVNALKLATKSKVGKVLVFVWALTVTNCGTSWSSASKNVTPAVEQQSEEALIVQEIAHSNKFAYTLNRSVLPVEVDEDLLLKVDGSRSVIQWNTIELDLSTLSNGTVQNFNVTKIDGTTVLVDGYVTKQVEEVIDEEANQDTENTEEEVVEEDSSDTVVLEVEAGNIKVEDSTEVVVEEEIQQEVILEKYSGYYTIPYELKNILLNTNTWVSFKLKKEESENYNDVDFPMNYSVILAWEEKGTVKLLLSKNQDLDWDGDYDLEEYLDGEMTKYLYNTFIFE